jgi:hypothetical protein
MSGAEIAARLGLRRVAPTEWRGACPSCNYATGLAVAERDGRPLWWCAVCQDSKAITAALRGVRLLPRRWHDCRPSPPRRCVADRTRSALGLFCAAAPDPVVETYLAGRGLELPGHAPIRFLAKCPHPSGMRLPAMLALVTTAAGEPIGVHRTYLRPDGSGKAEIEPDKATLGPTHGNAVVLHALATEIVVAEGVESALSAAQLFELPALAALTAGGLATARWLPSGISRVLIAADNDANGTGQRAAEKAARELVRRGIGVRISLPDTIGSDFNDVLVARSARKEGHGG